MDVETRVATPIGIQSEGRLGVDIGGTFTDIVWLRSDGTFATKKVLSTPNDYSEGIINGVIQLADEIGLSPGGIEQIIHATTVATNAILSGSGARTALLTTRGFRDVLELRRIRIPKLYDLFFEKPLPLVRRRHRLEVEERMSGQGDMLIPLNEHDVHNAIAQIRAEQLEAVAICFLNSYLRSDHERRAGDLVRAALPDTYLTLSCDVLPEIREYERTSTTVINAYVGPIVKRYLHSLAAHLERINVACPVLVMQSNGGMINSQMAMALPASMVESGPAAGAVAAAHMATTAGYPRVISFDMGGTTAKAALIEDGQLARTSEAEIGGGITLSSRLVKGGGYALKLPMIDLSEVGAGGGSVARLDKFGSLKVGPESAGVDPGPVGYDRGGQAPTITDANIVLGYINPDYVAGGSVRLNSQKSVAALTAQIALPMGRSVSEAAYAIHTLANASMIRGIKAVSTYRGRDPREFALFAFGGSGPIHAVEMARTLGMKRVVVPPVPGLFSAIGLLFADQEYHTVRTFLRRTDAMAPGELQQRFDEIIAQTEVSLFQAGFAHSKVQARCLADMRYKGQAFELTVPIPTVVLKADDVSRLDELFAEEHQRTFGHRARTDPVEIVNLRVVISEPIGVGQMLNPDKAAVRSVNASGVAGYRAAYFGARHGLLAAQVMDRQALANGLQLGPLIVEEYDATTVVPPGCQVKLDSWGNMVIDILDHARQ